MVALGVVALVVSSCSGRAGDGATPGDQGAPTVGAVAAEGLALYESSCIACHAEGGIGVEGLGRPLADSDFVRGLSDAELVAFIEVGRETTDPENTSGIGMPGKGGNPALTTADIEAIVAYLRTLN